MSTTDTHKDTGLIRGLRDRWRRSMRPRHDDPVVDLVRRGEFEMDPFRMMRELLRMDAFRQQDMWIPDFEVRENGSAIRIVADVPGAARDDIEISLNGNRLVVTGHRDAEARHQDENVVTYERRFGQFTRSFVLPDTADLEHISSDLRDGVLTIAVPMKPSAKPRKIQIGSGAKS